MKKQLYCIFNTQEKAERVICSLPLSYNLRWRRYDTFTDEGFLRPLYYVWYTPQQ